MSRLNFELPENPPEPARGPSKWLTGLLILILLGVAANIVIALNPMGILNGGRNTPAADSDQLKKIALKLEAQGLNNASARAWKAYMDTARLDDKQTALTWYRIGKLYQENHAYEEALDSYYRSEGAYAVDSIAPEIAMRIQECLESLGKFSAMRREVADRVTLESTGEAAAPGDPVLAEIGTRKITAAELDRRMEGAIDRQMNMMVPYLPEEERNKQKETLLKQVATPANRMMYLNQFVGEEILYRNAREGKLAENPKIRDLINDQERSLLASMALEKAYDDQIRINLSDLETYFTANKDAFKKDDQEPAFDEVKNEVYKTLRSQKEQEIRQQLLTRLKDQYDVVIHQSALTAQVPPAAETDK